MKIITTNKSASFEYFIEEKYEAGLQLQGNEVKSLRLGNVNMNDSFCFLREGEVCVKNMHIALYDKSDAFSTHDTRRDRKILLHKREIDKIAGKINRQGYTLVPLKLYFKGSLVKIEVALCRGKRDRRRQGSDPLYSNAAALHLSASQIRGGAQVYL